MRLLVTGGAGYVGSVCAAHLVEAGHAVVVLDDLSTGHRDAVPDGAEFVEGDVAAVSRDVNGCIQIKRAKGTVVLHEASMEVGGRLH